MITSHHSAMNLKALTFGGIESQRAQNRGSYHIPCAMYHPFIYKPSLPKYKLVLVCSQFEWVEWVDLYHRVINPVIG